MLPQRQKDDSAVQSNDPVLDAHETPSGAGLYNTQAEDDLLPSDDIFRFEIYPSVMDLAEGPLPALDQSTRWMLQVVIWDSVCGLLFSCCCTYSLDERTIFRQ